MKKQSGIFDIGHTVAHEPQKSQKVFSIDFADRGKGSTCRSPSPPKSTLELLNSRAVTKIFTWRKTLTTPRATLVQLAGVAC